MARLGDYVKIKTGKLDANVSDDNGKYPFFTCSKEPLRIETYSYDCECVLVAGNGDLNVKYHFGKFDAYQRTYIIESINKESLSVRYLYYFLDKYVETLREQSIGGVIKYIKLGNLTEAQIPLCPLDEQREIVALLDKVNDLIVKRRAQLDKLDLLVKARFVELFGDVETNPMNWPTSTIGAVVDSIEAGWSGNGTQREKQPGEIAVLKVSAVTKGYFIPSECKVLDDQKNIKKYVFPQKGDLLFSRANTREMVGATAVISEDYPELILPDKLWKIRFVNGVNVRYMKQVLSSKSVREKFSAASTGTSGSMYNVSMDKFKQIKIPVPSVDSQDNFSQFVEQTERIKFYICSSLDKLETMKKALMQEYFG